MASISQSVGRMGGKNLPDDVVTVKKLLNGVSPDNGGPTTPLSVASVHCDPKTIEAIQKFQLKHFGWKGADGRVDPDGPTIAKLNELSNASGLPQPFPPPTPTPGGENLPGCSVDQAGLINQAVKDAKTFLDVAIRRLRGISLVVMPDNVVKDTKEKVHNIFKIDFTTDMSSSSMVNAFRFASLLQDFGTLRASFNRKFPLRCDPKITNAAQVSNNFSDETITFGPRFFPGNADGAISNKDSRAVTVVHERAHTALRLSGHPGTGDVPVCVFPHLGFPGLSADNAAKNAWCYEWLTASLQPDYSPGKYMNVNICTEGGDTGAGG
ncbi:MAG: hypothetical protein WD875_07830 [Pirellulales bacterium]